MTLRHAEIFLAVYETGNMRRAAESLYISQPTVSGAIREIEEEYGVLLFNRLNHRLFITPEGELLASYARRLLALYREMEHQLKNRAALPFLRIGATLTVGTCILPDILQAKKEQLAARVTVNNTRSIEEQLLRGELDVGYVEGQIHHPDLIIEPVMEDRLIAVAAGPVPEPLSLAELCRRYSLLMREPGSGTREILDRALMERSLPCEEGWVCSNTQAILRAAEAGLGAAIISRLLAAEALHRGTLQEISLTDCELNRTFRLVWHKDKLMTPPLQLFRQACMEYAEKRV